MNLPMVFGWVQAKLHLGERDSKGASMVEYILLVAFIALVVLIAVTFLGEEASTKFSDAGDSLQNTPGT
jgi:Flp pilus assembly pilin Flp